MRFEILTVEVNVLEESAPSILSAEAFAHSASSCTLVFVKDNVNVFEFYIRALKRKLNKLLQANSPSQRVNGNDVAVAGFQGHEGGCAVS
jgi:hypothetical protein